MDYYDQIADGYEELHREEQEAKLNILKPHILPLITPATKLLDIGCGSGISLKPWDCDKVGIDPSKELLKIAQKKGLVVLQAGAEKIPFPDNSFDICISFTALHHTNYEISFKEIHRVCKDHFIFTLLKKSAQPEKELLEKYFTLVKNIDLKKDVGYICKKKY